jgi:hypothetical protein
MALIGALGGGADLAAWAMANDDQVGLITQGLEILNNRAGLDDSALKSGIKRPSGLIGLRETRP